MSERSKAVRYYSEQDVKQLIHRLQTSNVNPVSIERDFWDTAKPLTLRPEVAAFAQAMEDKLRQNDHKGGWQDEGTGYLLFRLDEEVGELIQEFARTGSKPTPESVRSETADVANFAMMIADVMGGLKGE